MSNFILGGITVPLYSAVNFQQDYEALGGFSHLRLAGGKAVKQTNWEKLRTGLSGDGWIPDGLTGLDYSQAMILSCAAPRGITSASNVITVPAARRSDAGYLPIGYGLIGGVPVHSPVNVSVDEVTITLVTGATAYQAWWYPELEVFADPVRSDFSKNTGTWIWSLDCEES